MDSTAWSTTTAFSTSGSCTTGPKNSGSRNGSMAAPTGKARRGTSAQPRNHVDQWKTPMLVIHGGLDYRVPLEQGIGAFTALQRQGIPSQFLYFPDENHWVLSPANGIQWHETVLAWMERWTRN